MALINSIKFYQVLRANLEELFARVNMDHSQYPILSKETNSLHKNNNPIFYCHPILCNIRLSHLIRTTERKKISYHTGLPQNIL